MILYYLGFLALMSLIAFVMYFIDKEKAKRKKCIKEAALLSVGFFGGAVGALAAMTVFRHKTKHYYFYVVNVLGLIVQAAVAVLILK